MINLLNYILLMAPQTTPAGKSSPLTSLLPFILILVIIYFFMIRPQSKKAKEQRAFKEQLKKGDKVVTIGGIHGKIIDILEKDFIIEIATNVRITVQKEAISMEASKLLNESDKK